MPAKISLKTLDDLHSPADPKAQKSLASAKEWLRARNTRGAVEELMKADKQDGGHCPACALAAFHLAEESRDYEQAAKAAELLETTASTAVDRAFCHYKEGLALLHVGTQRSKDTFYSAAVQQFQLASQQQPAWDAPKFANGLALAHLKQDQAAQQQFKEFLALAPKTSNDRTRAERYLERPELARARMVPNFNITLADGSSLTLDSLQGKVVLLDFWATWCGPCKESLPHVRAIAHKFSEEPLIVLGISWDKDEQKWRDFIQENGMVWAQYRDTDHHLSDLFAVQAIPRYFTIDADGVLQDEEVGSNSDVEGRLKKLLAQTKKRQANASISQVSQGSALKEPIR